MPELAYAIYDVFTNRALAGNPLAVVFDAGALDTSQMQAIAREFNLSETVFVLPPERAPHRARIRIFTPDYEMPFAGHPTVGAAVALGSRTQALGIAEILILEENIGAVRCAVTRGDDSASFAEFGVPKLPEQLPFDADAGAVAAALGLAPHEIGFENHRIAAWSAGVPYVTVPVSGLEAAGRVQFDNALWMALSPKKSLDAVASAYIYTRQTVDHSCQFHARMFVPGNPSYEDPATGSAAAAYAGQVMLRDAPVDGTTRVWIEQGLEMGRPSRLRLDLDVEGGALAAARIGGHAVKVAEGRLLL